MKPVNQLYVIDAGITTTTATQLDPKVQYQTYAYDLHFYTAPLNYLALDLSSNTFMSPHDPGATNLTRQEFEGGFAFLFPEKSSIGLHYKTIQYSDKLTDGTKISTKLDSPRAELKLWPWPSNIVGAEFTATQFNYAEYTSYNHNMYEAHAVFTPRWSSNRRLKGTKQSVPYSLPIEMHLTYFTSSFSKTEIPTNDRVSPGKTFSGVSYGLKLFW